MTVIDPTGTITSVPGFRAGAAYAGMKTFGEGKLDIAIFAADRPCNVAATFTKNVLHSASVDINRAHLADGRAQAVVVNAGIANSSTGQRGIGDGRQATEWVALKVNVTPANVLICSTGVIGHYLPMDKMRAGIDAITLDRDIPSGEGFARAIMTTDTRPKHGSVRFGSYTIGGCTKGSGMIHPNMATMLAFLATDACIEPGFLQRSLSRAVEMSFNRLSIDGDTSPSDTALLFSPAGGTTEITADSPLAGAFGEALESMCIYLAKEMARDGEGATRLIEVTVTGAVSENEATALVRLLTTSYLLKSAVHGADPNWGRIISVVGRSGLRLSEPGVTVDLCGFRVFENEQPTTLVIDKPEAVSEAMTADTVTIGVHLGVGDASATGWGCDLSAEYVHINADYHT
jgi:glutamate N-acetyltransferase/amino-acid N-acetyltransferase